MRSTEDKIWDSITDSAKEKIDYMAFEEAFSYEEEVLADTDLLLFKLIVDFASDKTEPLIAIEIKNQLLLSGFDLELSQIQELLQGKKEALRVEIFCARTAAHMLENGENPSTVYNAVRQLLMD